MIAHTNRGKKGLDNVRNCEHYVSMKRSQQRTGGLSLHITHEIKTQLTQNNTTITALSHQTGLRRPLLSQRLNNHSPLTLAELDKIAQALGTSPTVIIANAEQRRNAFASSELVDDSRSPSTAQ